MWLKAFRIILTVCKWLSADNADPVHSLSYKTIGYRSPRYEKLCAPESAYS